MFRLSPLGNGSFVPSLVEFGQMVLKKKVKMWKFIDSRTDGHQTQMNLIYNIGSLKYFDSSDYM